MLANSRSTVVPSNGNGYTGVSNPPSFSPNSSINSPASYSPIQNSHLGMNSGFSPAALNAAALALLSGNVGHGGNGLFNGLVNSSIGGGISGGQVSSSGSLNGLSSNFNDSTLESKKLRLHQEQILIRQQEYFQSQLLGSNSANLLNGSHGTSMGGYPSSGSPSSNMGHSRSSPHSIGSHHGSLNGHTIHSGGEISGVSGGGGGVGPHSQSSSHLVGSSGISRSSRDQRDGDFGRSPLLEEFRNTKNKKHELRDIVGCIVEFSGDQHGSRFIQQKLETANSEDKEFVFNELLPNALQLMTDVFGNYVIQKFFEHGNQIQKQILASQMEGHVLSLSLQMYGCRVVQKALEHVLPNQQSSLVHELEGSVLKCVKDQNGNHVIQKAIERVALEHIKFIIDSFHGQVYTLATHPYGCRVIQRIFENCVDKVTVKSFSLHYLSLSGIFITFFPLFKLIFFSLP